MHLTLIPNLQLYAVWALIGECDKSKEYMTLNCAPVCQTCMVRSNGNDNRGEEL